LNLTLEILIIRFVEVNINISINSTIIFTGGVFIPWFNVIIILNPIFTAIMPSILAPSSSFLLSIINLSSSIIISN